VSATAATVRKEARPGRLGRAAVALRRRRSEIGLLAPTVLILLGLSLYPTIYNLWQSLQTSEVVGPSTFGGLKNYTSLLSDHRFWTSALVTLQFMAITVTATMVLGMGLAVALDRVTDRTRRLLLPLVIMPMAMSPIVVGLIFKFLYNDAVGPINWFIGLIGPDPDNSFLAQTSTAVWAVAVVDIWQWTPFAVLVFLAALQSLPGGPIEAARSSCCARWTPSGSSTSCTPRPAAGRAPRPRRSASTSSAWPSASWTSATPGRCRSS
jgi:multiple sugar transport system permease protein